MAWTGIASILLPKGMTSHRTFRLPLDLSKIETSFLKLDSDKKLLREADIIIWDEASMITKKVLEIVDATLRDLCKEDNKPFAGKIVILGGDFRQILPVVKNGTREMIIEDTIKYSYLWKNFKFFKSSKNIRASDEEFCKFLLNIGNGNIENFEITDEWTTNDICTNIYGDNLTENDSVIDRVILSSHNENIHKINNIILNKLYGNKKIHYSIDYATYEKVNQKHVNISLNFPVKYLNSLQLPGFPVYKLTLKKGAIVVLIRNLSVTEGLCNRTRLNVINLYNHNIEV